MSTSPLERLSAALADRYRIERELGAGGMATVYLAADLKHDRKVAIKVLKPELAAVLGAERFVVEIKTTAALQHPHILPLFDSGTADGFLYYVMPYIQGETIRDRLNRESQFGVEEAIRIAREVADALDYAHRQGVIHRDIKPENLLLHDGRPMVMDFGIALAVSAAAGGRMTETGLSLGTPHYMSPEQATAEKEISPRSDVYSLASVLYEMLAGQPPHIGGVAQQVIMKIITERAQPVTALRRSVPPHVAAALERALEKLPADRFESAARFAAALGDASFTVPTQVSAAAAPGGRWPRGARITVGALAVLALAAGVVAAWGLRTGRPSADLTKDRVDLLDGGIYAPGILGRAATISPDGERIVFIDRGSRLGRTLLVKERARVDPAPLDGPANVIGGLAFSPDGAWIAYVGADGVLRKVPSEGGAPLVLADSAEIGAPSVAWLDDGTLLYVGVAGSLRAVRDDGSARRLLHRGLREPKPELARYISALAGGRGALVTLCTPACGAAAVHVLDLQASTPTFTRLAESALAAWQLTTGDVVVARRDGGVLAAPFDAGAMRITKALVPVMQGVRTTLNTADMVVSRSGELLYVDNPGGGAASTVEATTPVWVDRNGVETAIDSSWSVDIRRDRLGSFGRGLAIAPKGDRLAIRIPRATSASQSDFDLWVKQLGAAPRTLTKLTFEGDVGQPTWSRDGRFVLFTTGGLSQTGMLRRRRADGTGPVDTLVRLSRGINDAVVTGDSTRVIVRLITPPSRDIALATVGDTTVVPVMMQGYSEVSPTLSPDGRWLAYASDETGRFEVYVRPWPDWNSGRWVVSAAGGVEPLWSSSGRELFFRDAAGALIEAAVLPGPTFTLGPQKRLFDANAYAGTEGSLIYDVAPDAKRFAMLRLREPSGASDRHRLVLVRRWADEVRATLAGGGRR